MPVFILKRLTNAVFVMLAVAALAFAIFQVSGDPVELMANEQMSQADRDALRDRMGLNDPMVVQFARFVGTAAQGDFGMSWRNGQSVLGLIAERFPATMELVLTATFLSLVIGCRSGC